MWQVWHETPVWAPVRSEPWQPWQREKFQFCARTRFMWNSGSFGFKIPPSWMLVLEYDTRPSTTHARDWLKAEDTGWCTVSALAGSMTFNSVELESPGTASGALVGPSASRYEVVRYPACAPGPEWQELHCDAYNGAMSCTQLTGWAGSPCCWRASEQAAVASAAARTPSILCMRPLRAPSPCAPLRLPRSDSD